jgi:hypothetical protein
MLQQHQGEQAHDLRLSGKQFEQQPCQADRFAAERGAGTRGIARPAVAGPTLERPQARFLKMPLLPERPQ